MIITYNRFVPVFSASDVMEDASREKTLEPTSAVDGKIKQQSNSVDVPKQNLCLMFKIIRGRQIVAGRYTHTLSRSSITGSILNLMSFSSLPMSCGIPQGCPVSSHLPKKTDGSDALSWPE